MVQCNALILTAPLSSQRNNLNTRTQSIARSINDKSWKVTVPAISVQRIALMIRIDITDR
jgi:hypothetical protein